MKLALGITLLVLVVGTLFTATALEHGWIGAAIAWGISLALAGLLVLAIWLIATP